jgi:hypothetical protein
MAVLLNGINQGLNASATSLAQNVTQCTLMAWINVQSFPSVSGGIVQVNTNSTGTSSRINLLLLNSGAIRIGGRAPDSMPTITSIDSTATITATNTWFHIVGILDFANSVGYLYINGVQSATTGALVFSAAVTDNTSSYAVNLGSDENNTGEWCNVIIDDARVYHRILTDNEIQTIYACQGSDEIVQDLQARWFMYGDENQNIGDVSTISISNVRNTSSISSGSSLTLSSYAVPVGSSLILVVAATAEGTNSGRVMASNISFNGTNLTNATAVRTTSSPYNGVSLWYMSVASGATGNIIVTWSGNNSRKTVFAMTLVNAQSTLGATATSFSNTGVTTTGLTTSVDSSLVVTACANEDGYVMTTVGTNHTLNSSIVADVHAGAIGNVTVPVAGAISGIGYTASPTPGGEALVLAEFNPVIIPGQIEDLTNNKYLLTALNNPKYVSTLLRTRASSLY